MVQLVVLMLRAESQGLDPTAINSMFSITLRGVLVHKARKLCEDIRPPRCQLQPWTSTHADSLPLGKAKCSARQDCDLDPSENMSSGWNGVCNFMAARLRETHPR